MSIKLKNVSKTFYIKDTAHQVIDDISCEFAKGSISVIVGKSGCGKTTLLRMVAGLEPLTEGDVHSDGKIGYVFQEPRLFPWLTVSDNIMFAGKEKNRGKLEELLSMLGLHEFADAYPSQISGGMAQRTALGRVLYFDPDIILMDEPFASLDYFTRKALQEDIVKIREKTGKTMIMVTHDLDEAIALGEDIFVMKKGKFIAEMDTSAISGVLDAESMKEKILSLL